MKLYSADMAPNPRRVTWVMAEKGITDIETVSRNLVELEHRAHDRILQSGSAGLPVLELDDGSLLSESMAICRYLESLYPEPNLFGTDTREQAEIEMWTRRIELHMANPLMMAVRLLHPLVSQLEGAINEPVGTWFRDLGGSYLPKLNAHLADKDFIAASRFTIADIVGVCALDFVRLIRYAPPAEFEHITRWRKAIRERPATR